MAANSALEEMVAPLYASKTALTDGDILGAVHAVELGKEGVGCDIGADALGLSGSVHPDAGDGAVGRRSP